MLDSGLSERALFFLFFFAFGRFELPWTVTKTDMLQRSYQANLVLTLELPRRVMIHPINSRWWSYNEQQSIPKSLSVVLSWGLEKCRVEKQKIKSEGSESNSKCFAFRHSSKQWKRFSLRKKVLKPAQSSFFLLIFFLDCFYPPVFFFFVLGKRKTEKAIPMLGWRKQHRELRCEEIFPCLLWWTSPSSCCSELRKSSSCGWGKGTGLVGESLTGFFPTTGCAPHVSLLHAVHLAALLRLPTGFPGSGCRFRGWCY